MADFFTGSPRRIAALIRLHPAEVAAVVTHPDMLGAFTGEELDRMFAAIADETERRNNAGAA